MEVSSLYLNVEFKHVGNQRLEASEELNTHSYLEDEGASMVRNLNVGSVADRDERRNVRFITTGFPG